MSKIFNLTCENANLGGPMGFESTTYMYTKPFKTLARAKAYAEGSVKYWPIWAEWKREGNEWAVDCGPYIFTIKKEKIQ